MTDDDKDLDELFAPLREEAKDLGDHPTPEELSAYHAKELSPADNLRVREHIVACRECADLVLDLQALYDTGRKETSAVADFEQAAAWRDLREQIPFRPDDRIGIPEEKAEPRRPSFFAPLWSARGIAAALAVVAVSGILAYRLREPTGSQVVTLDPVGSARGPEDRRTARLSDNLVLWLPSGDSHAEYQVEIRKDGRVVETLSDVRKDNPTELVLEEPGSSLEPGRYEIVLFGLGPDKTREEIETYVVLFKDS